MPIARRWVAACTLLLSILGCSHVDVAPHGDLAYALAKTTTTVSGPDGTSVSLRGKAATVWRKGPDGRWRCVVDVWNDDPPLKP